MKKTLLSIAFIGAMGAAAQMAYAGSVGNDVKHVGGNIIDTFKTVMNSGGGSSPASAANGIKSVVVSRAICSSMGLACPPDMAQKGAQAIKNCVDNGRACACTDMNELSGENAGMSLFCEGLYTCATSVIPYVDLIPSVNCEQQCNSYYNGVDYNNNLNLPAATQSAIEEAACYEADPEVGALALAMTITSVQYACLYYQKTGVCLSESAYQAQFENQCSKYLKSKACS